MCMKNRLFRFSKKLFGTMGLLLIGALMYSCSDDYDLPDKTPGWLGSSIYDYLTDPANGNYTNMVRLIDDTYRRYGKDIYLGLHGESLGSATTITALRHRPDVRFAIADCGFADLETVLTDIASSLHMGRSTVWMTWLGTRVKHRVSIFKIRPIRGLRDNKVPVMFIHGLEDTYIPPRHSRRMYRAVTAYKELHLIPGATHAASVLTAPEDYRRYVTGFLKKVEKLEISTLKSKRS